MHSKQTVRKMVETFSGCLWYLQVFSFKISP